MLILRVGLCREGVLLLIGCADKREVAIDVVY